MRTFAVVEVIDANTIRVKPSWSFVGETGNKVKIRGYYPQFNPDVPKFDSEEGILFAKKIAKERLIRLFIRNAIVQINVDISSSDLPDSENEISAYVFHNKVPVHVYFADMNCEK